jgi:hypothetical protein
MVPVTPYIVILGYIKLALHSDIVLTTPIMATSWVVASNVGRRLTLQQCRLILVARFGLVQVQPVVWFGQPPNLEPDAGGKY